MNELLPTCIKSFIVAGALAFGFVACGQGSRADTRFPLEFISGQGPAGWWCKFESTTVYSKGATSRHIDGEPCFRSKAECDQRAPAHAPGQQMYPNGDSSTHEVSSCQPAPWAACFVLRVGGVPARAECVKTEDACERFSVSMHDVLESERKRGLASGASRCARVQ